MNYSNYALVFKSIAIKLSISGKNSKSYKIAASFRILKITSINKTSSIRLFSLRHLALRTVSIWTTAKHPSSSSYPVKFPRWAIAMYQRKLSLIEKGCNMDIEYPIRELTNFAEIDISVFIASLFSIWTILQTTLHLKKKSMNGLTVSSPVTFFW